LVDNRVKHDLDSVLAYLIQYKLANDGNSPTIREICDSCDIPSTSVGLNVLHRMQKAGLITLDERNVNRKIQIVGGRWVYDGARSARDTQS
jgi:hypothetical protein